MQSDTVHSFYRADRDCLAVPASLFDCTFISHFLLGEIDSQGLKFHELPPASALYNFQSSAAGHPMKWPATQPGIVLTLRAAQHRLQIDIQQVWVAGKAVRIGHGPATVNGETP
jgi:hypothetical protein